MNKLLNLYRKLSPSARFRLIFFILASLIVVPVWRNTGVEVYEPYRYNIEDVEKNQVVFAYRVTHYIGEDSLWIFQKNGFYKQIDLVEKSESNDCMYEPVDFSDLDLLKKMDTYMGDSSIKMKSGKLLVDKEKLKYYINIENIELKRTGDGAADSKDYTYYLVIGAGENRHLEEMRVEGAAEFTCADFQVNQVCRKIAEICGR